MINHTKFFCDLGFRQVRKNWDTWIEPASKFFRAELVVQRNHLFDKGGSPDLVNQSLVVALTSFDMRDPVGHVKGRQFPGDATLDATKKSVLRLQEQVEILPGELSSVSLLQVGVHALEVEEELGVKVRRDVAVMWQQILVVVASEQARNALGEPEVLVGQTTQVTQARQIIAPNREITAFPGSRSTTWGTPLGDVVGTQAAAVHPFPGKLMPMQMQQQQTPSWRPSVPTPLKVLR